MKRMFFISVLMTLMMISCSKDEIIETVNSTVTNTVEYVLDPEISLDYGDSLTVEDYLFLPNITVKELTVFIIRDGKTEVLDTDISPKIKDPEIVDAWENLPDGLGISPRKLFARPVKMEDDNFTMNVHIIYTIRQRNMNTEKGWVTKSADADIRENVNLLVNDTNPVEISIEPEEIPTCIPLLLIPTVSDWETEETTSVFE